MIIFIAVIHCEDPYFPAPLHMKLEGGCQRPKIYLGWWGNMSNLSVVATHCYKVLKGCI